MKVVACNDKKYVVPNFVAYPYFFLSLFYSLLSIETFDSLVWRLASSLSKEALSRL